MFKAILNILISTTLITAILLPPVFSLLEIEMLDLVINAEKIEIEEKEVEEKTIFLDDLTSLNKLPNEHGMRFFIFNKDNKSSHTVDIFLPPPELIF